MQFVKKAEQVNKEKIREKTKVFFRSQTWKNILVFLVFVALAFCFWTLQYFQQKMEYEVSIPIEYTNTPKEFVINDTLPNEISLRLLDRGIVFLQYYFSKNFTSIEIDLETLPQGKKTHLIDRSTLQAKIQNILFPTTQLLAFTPETIQISIAPLKKKLLPVIIDGTISLTSGFMFSDSLHIEPSTVWIYGDKNNVDTIHFIKTQPVNHENIQKKLDFSVRLVVPPYVQLSEEKVRITAEVEGYTEKKIEMPVVCRNLPENVHVRFFPSSVEVFGQVALSKYAQLTENDLEVSVDYNELANGQSLNVVLSLTKRPKWLVNYRIQPETVEYLIEQKKGL